MTVARKAAANATKAGRHIVIGGLGNLGQKLQHYLLKKEGASVHVIDRPRRHQREVDAALVDADEVAFTPYALGEQQQGDNTTINGSLTNLVEGAECIYCVVTPDVQHGTVREFRQTNQIGIQQLVQAAREAGVPKLVYASSIAVTNHFLPAYNQSEKDPLPDLDSYQNEYDRSKRLGEDIVLAAGNDNCPRRHNLKTCALRLGGIISGHSDYMFRGSFQTGEASGKVYTIAGEPIDSIAASDVAAALVRANHKLDDDSSRELHGNAVYMTKSRNDKPATTNMLTEKLAKLMGWQCHYIPPIMFSAVRNGAWMRYSLESLLKNEQDLPGMPLHRYIDIPRFEQTFDNTLAHQLLDFKPLLSWEEAVEQVVEDYKRAEQGE